MRAEERSGGEGRRERYRGGWKGKEGTLSRVWGKEGKEEGRRGKVSVEEGG